MNKNSSNSSKGEGNTKLPQIAASKHWCLTWNNYPEDFLEAFKDSSIERYILGKEVGESGTPHIQGFISFNPKKRPLSVIPIKGIHWEKARCTKEAIAYCAKDGDYILKGITIPKKLKCLEEENLFKWQEGIVNILKEEPSDRNIYWFYDEEGNIGKSVFCKYLVIKHDALVLSGKAADMKYAISEYIKKNGYGPEKIIIDLPRSFNKSFLSYQGIEEIKNGLFFSGKFESNMVCFNCPHIIIFSNEYPDKSKLSADRWVITNLRGDA